jgi:hypothetical protein
MSRVVTKGADFIVLSGVAPADAPLLIKTARELDFKGTLATETAQDIKILNEVAGAAADSFICVGGRLTPPSRHSDAITKILVELLLLSKPGVLICNRADQDGKAGDAYSQGDRGTCGKPPPGSALPGSSLSDRPGCGQRGGRRCRSLNGAGSALGSDGTELDL